MAGEKELLSDTESVEKPVREQLKKASINTADIQATVAPGKTMDPAADTETGRLVDENHGREPRKKRSFEEDEDDTTATKNVAEGKHRRKRSRDSTIEQDTPLEGQMSTLSPEVQIADVKSTTNGERVDQSDSVKSSTSEGAAILSAQTDMSGMDEAANKMASPKTKRSRLHSSLAQDEEVATSIQASSENAQSDTSVPKKDEGHGNNVATKVPPTSGFADTSFTSPFGALTGSKENGNSTQKPLTSFATSSFKTLSQSSTSGFGTVGKTSGGFGNGGGFATGKIGSFHEGVNGEDDQAKDRESGSVFGGTRQKSAFEASSGAVSGFGSGSSTFGAVKQGGGIGTSLGGSGFGALGGDGLKNFASHGPTLGFASNLKPSKRFGPSAEDEDDKDDNDGDDDEAGFKSPTSQEKDKQDDRFYHQDLETGEEDELMEYSCRAKLYNFTTIADGKKEWRERGLGVLRLNVSKGVKPEGDGEATKAELKTQARFLMRADGSHRVVLNTPIKKEIKFGAPTGGAPQGGCMYFMGTIDKGDGKPGGLELLQLRIKQQFAQELYDRVVELQAEM